ncbi:MAG: hypothetical protein JJE34_00600 [Alphaproteobacteria bacterium]|nr:hypothetical protein [Alphaproteobacteria bacterium]
MSDNPRNVDLDRLEAMAGPRTTRDIVDILVFPVTALHDDYYVQFIVMLSMTHRDLMMDAIENRWNSGYSRCLDDLRRLIPPMPTALQNQRFVFMGTYLGAVPAARQRALSDRSRSHPTWGSDVSLEHFVQSVTTVLEAPVNFPAEALATIGVDGAPLPRDYGPVG